MCLLGWNQSSILLHDGCIIFFFSRLPFTSGHRPLVIAFKPFHPSQCDIYFDKIKPPFVWSTNVPFCSSRLLFKDSFCPLAPILLSNVSYLAPFEVHRKLKHICYIWSTSDNIIPDFNLQAYAEHGTFHCFLGGSQLRCAS